MRTAFRWERDLRVRIAVIGLPLLFRAYRQGAIGRALTRPPHDPRRGVGKGDREGGQPLALTGTLTMGDITLQVKKSQAVKLFLAGWWGDATEAGKPCPDGFRPLRI